MKPPHGIGSGITEQKKQIMEISERELFRLFREMVFDNLKPNPADWGMEMVSRYESGIIDKISTRLCPELFSDDLMIEIGECD